MFYECLSFSSAVKGLTVSYDTESSSVDLMAKSELKLTLESAL
jgi:hypothetical protein